MQGMLTLEDLARLADDGAIHTVMAAAVDMQGRLVGKRFHVRQFLDGAHRETQCCSSILATDPDMARIEGMRVAGRRQGYGDYTMRPDLATLRRAAWRPGTALILCDLLDALGHAAIPHSPRQILKQQVSRVRKLGYEAVAGTELEFHVFGRSHEAIRQDNYADLSGVRAGGQHYDLLKSGAEEPVMARLRNALFESGVPVEGSKAEAGAGQAELNLRHGPALEAAANHAIARHAAKDIGADLGRAVSFLPKLHPDREGSASHIHLSLWKGPEPAFLDDTMPHGMSRLMRAFIGGLLRSLDACTVFLAPSINGYKRFRPGGFAPTRKVWSVDNRSAALRLCGEGTGGIRIECRVPGADANPYLALAALLAAGLDGVERHLDCGDPASGDANAGGGAPIPRSLREATLALHGSSVLRGAMGDAVVDHYVRAAEWEEEAFSRAVTDWEIRRGFDSA